MWDDCHAVGLLCFFFLVVDEYLCLFLPRGLTNECIISIFIFQCCKQERTAHAQVKTAESEA